MLNQLADALIAGFMHRWVFAGVLLAMIAHYRWANQKVTTIALGIAAAGFLYSFTRALLKIF